MNYRVTGEKEMPCIVFINGAGTGPWMWTHQENALSNYRCIFFDLPGHGENRTLEFSTIRELGKMVSELIIEECITKKAMVIGHSIGAQTVMSMLDNYPEVIEKAIIISGLNNPMKMAIPLIKPMVSVAMPLAKYRWYAKLQSGEFNLPDELFEYYYEVSKRMRKETLISILKENMSFCYNPRANPSMPVMLLVGQKEKGIMKKSIKKTNGVVQSKHCYIVEEAAHGIPYEKPELLNQLIKKFHHNHKDEYKIDGLIPVSNS